MSIACMTDPTATVTLEAIVRCRPLLDHEQTRNCEGGLGLPFELIPVRRQILANGNEYILDGVIGQEATQADVYVC